MSSEDARAVLGIMLVVAVASLIIGMGLGEEFSASYWQSEAIARGVAGYDEQTGEWKWTVERKVA